jgi:hypothetical protein
MQGTRVPVDTVSLATVNVGEEFEIIRVLLGSAERGGDSHLRPGRRWYCRFRGSATILLTNTAGQTISVRADIARAVQVRRGQESITPVGSASGG